MNKVVVFERLTARVLWNPDDLGSYKKRKDALVNPDTSLVEPHPMEYWKKDEDKVVMMSDDEKKKRDILINYDRLGITPEIERIEAQIQDHRYMYYWYSAAAVVSAVIIYAVLHNL